MQRQGSVLPRLSKWSSAWPCPGAASKEQVVAVVLRVTGHHCAVGLWLQHRTSYQPAALYVVVGRRDDYSHGLPAFARTCGVTELLEKSRSTTFVALQETRSHIRSASSMSRGRTKTTNHVMPPNVRICSLISVGSVGIAPEWSNSWQTWPQSSGKLTHPLGPLTKCTISFETTLPLCARRVSRQACSRRLADASPPEATFRQIWPSIGEHWPKLGQTLPDFDQIGLELAHQARHCVMHHMLLNTAPLPRGVCREMHTRKIPARSVSAVRAAVQRDLPAESWELAAAASIFGRLPSVFRSILATSGLFLRAPAQGGPSSADFPDLGFCQARLGIAHTSTESGEHRIAPTNTEPMSANSGPTLARCGPSCANFDEGTSPADTAKIGSASAKFDRSRP